MIVFTSSLFMWDTGVTGRKKQYLQIWQKSSIYRSDSSPMRWGRTLQIMILWPGFMKSLLTSISNIQLKRDSAFIITDPNKSLIIRKSSAAYSRSYVNNEVTRTRIHLHFWLSWSSRVLNVGDFWLRSESSWLGLKLFQDLLTRERRMQGAPLSLSVNNILTWL